MAVNYTPGKEAVQVTASPNISTVQARFDTAPTDTVGQLAQALNIAAPAAEKAIQTYEAVETLKGTQDAKGMTLEEQRKLIDNKELMESHSSAYVATVQHLYGQNAMDRARRETLDGLAKGTLSFDSNEALDKYITDKRNTALSGQSKFTIAGFDKNLDAFASTVGTVNSEKVNSDFVARAAAVRDEHIQSVVGQVSGAGYKGTPEEAGATIMASFGLTKESGVLPIAQSKESFKSMLNSVVATGNKALMEVLLGSSTHDGLKVGSLVGGDQARLFTAQVDATATKSQREALDLELTPFSTAARAGELNLKDWAGLRKKHEKIFTDERYQSMIDRNDAAIREKGREVDRVSAQTAAYSYNSEQDSRLRDALENGKFGTHPPGKRMNARTGEVSDFNETDAAAEYLVGFAKQTKMAPDDVIKIFSTNGLVNPELKKEVMAAIGNLGSVGWAFNGKDIGVLSSQAEEGIKKALRVLEVDPGNLSKYVGSDAAVNDLQNIDMAMKYGGSSNLNAAATLVNAAKHSGISDKDFALRSKDIANRVAAMVNPAFYSSTVTGIGNMFERRNEVVNEVQMASSLRKGAEFLLKSGSAATVEEALAAVQKYQALPSVSTVIDNTRYFNTDLPTVPAGANQAAYVKLFKREVIAKDYGDKAAAMPSVLDNFKTLVGTANPVIGRILETGKPNDRPVKSDDGQEIVLQKGPGGGYTAMLGAFPAEDKNGNVLRYSRVQMESWIRERHAADQAKEIANSNRALSRKQERAKGQLSGETPSLSSGVPYSEQ